MHSISGFVNKIDSSKHVAFTFLHTIIFFSLFINKH